mmetsp:Transcript_8730/g.20727  ORF Transcript_8730/g.20727 Transcript_8730/m.20727 type:complete len:226 (-) Transcript_8730:409-1086(-)
MLAIGGFFVDQIHDEAGRDETHREDNGEGHEQVCDHLVSSGHLLLNELLGLRQRMIPDLDSAVVEAQQLHPSVVPKIHHDGDTVVGLALEPHRQVGLPSVFARQGEGTVAVDEVLPHIWIHEVFAHQSASTGHLDAVSVTLSLIERANEASRQRRIKLVCKRNLVLRELTLATTPDGAHELVRGEAERRLLHLHLQNPSRQQCNEDKERWKQHLRSPGTPVTTNR